MSVNELYTYIVQWGAFNNDGDGNNISCYFGIGDGEHSYFFPLT